MAQKRVKKTAAKKVTVKRTKSLPEITENAEGIPQAPTTGHFVQSYDGIVANAMLSRSAFYNQMMDGQNRDIDQECGYPKAITNEQYRAFYDREGVAARVVSCMPEETWAVMPKVKENEEDTETAFEAAWNELEEAEHLFHFLQRGDELSGIGRFGILLMGFDDGLELKEPVVGSEEGQSARTGAKLIYLKVFDESCVTVKAWEREGKNARYGLPTMYAIQYQDRAADGTDSNTLGADVHWSRVLHIADERKMSEVYGTPRMKKVFNRLMDIRKVLSASGEMYWRGGFPGFSFEVNPDLVKAGAEIDATAMREEFQNYANGLQRYMALTGVTAKSLSVQVTDPTPHVAAHLKAVALALSIPFRILFGSEQAQLASSQDSKTWNKRLRKRQEMYVSPMIIRPFVDRLVAVGVLPEPKQVIIDWPDLDTPSDQEQAQVGVTRTDALVKYVGGGADVLIAPASFMRHVLGMDQAVVDAILEEAEEYADDQADEDFDDTDDQASDDQMDVDADDKGGDIGDVEDEAVDEADDVEDEDEDVEDEDVQPVAKKKAKKKKAKKAKKSASKKDDEEDE